MPPLNTPLGTSRKWGALKYTELLHIKTDISQLKIMRYFKKFVFMSEKDPAAFIRSFGCDVYDRVKIYVQQ